MAMLHCGRQRVFKFIFSHIFPLIYFWYNKHLKCNLLVFKVTKKIFIYLEKTDHENENLFVFEMEYHQMNFDCYGLTWYWEWRKELGRYCHIFQGESCNMEIYTPRSTFKKVNVLTRPDLFKCYWKICRGYYTVAWWYGFYLRVMKTIF